MPCPHDIIGTVCVGDSTPSYMYCIDCDAKFEHLDSTEYAYDIDQNVWRRIDEPPFAQWFTAELKKEIEDAIAQAFKFPPYDVESCKSEEEQVQIVDEIESFRTSPEICGHRFIIPTEPGEFDLAICISCSSTIGSDYREDKHYEYDAAHEVWSYVGPCGF